LMLAPRHAMAIFPTSLKSLQGQRPLRSGLRRNGLEIGLTTALLGEAAALVWFAPTLSITLQLILWAQVIATFAAAEATGLVRLVGPIFFYDLVRMARRRRYFLLRMGCPLLFVLLLVLFGVNKQWPMTPLAAEDSPDSAATFFAMFVLT